LLTSIANIVKQDTVYEISIAPIQLDVLAERMML